MRTTTLFFAFIGILLLHLTSCSSAQPHDHRKEYGLKGNVRTMQSTVFRCITANASSDTAIIDSNSVVAERIVHYSPNGSIDSIITIFRHPNTEMEDDRLALVTITHSEAEMSVMYDARREKVGTDSLVWHSPYHYTEYNRDITGRITQLSISYLDQSLRDSIDEVSIYAGDTAKPISTSKVRYIYDSEGCIKTNYTTAGPDNKTKVTTYRQKAKDSKGNPTELWLCDSTGACSFILRKSYSYY